MSSACPAFSTTKPHPQLHNMLQILIAKGHIRLGICCMEVKLRCKPMRDLIRRFQQDEFIHVIEFLQDMIMNKDVAEWPECEALICFHSKGFPLEKAIQYTERHPKMWAVNNVVYQRSLLDRRWFYEAMRANNIPMVKFVIMSRDGYMGRPMPEFIEAEDYVQIDGVRINKPFVEKPVDANDHAVHVYFPNGGGCVRLFRKVDNRSSEHLPHMNDVRTESSYIYEEYVPTDDASDVKVYAVGYDYQYAEMRKSPVVDGQVERDVSGYEKRNMAKLTQEEVEMTQKVVQVFKQRVCGLDLLRGNGRSYVCDVNGWSFVKNCPPYNERLALTVTQLLKEAMLRRGLPYVVAQKRRVLRGCFSLFRHADRTPKQKTKVRTSNPAILDVLVDQTNAKDRTIKSTSRIGDYNKLLQLKEVIRKLLQDAPEEFGENDRQKLRIMAKVIGEKHEGLKVQLKVKKRTNMGRCTKGLLICKWGGWLTDEGIAQARTLGELFPSRVSPINRTLSKHEFLDNLRVCTNSERRVMKTGLEFVRALCRDERVFHESDLDVNNDLMEPGSMAKEKMEVVKEKISQIMHLRNRDDPLFQEHISTSPGLHSIRPSPLEAMARAYELIQELIRHIPKNAPLHGDETAMMMKARWMKLLHDFYCKERNVYDTTKIPDIFDYIVYDSIYNQKALQGLDMFPLFRLAEVMALFVVQGEYGLDAQEKLRIGALTARPLLERLVSDMQDIASGSNSRLRLYFSSESLIHAFLNLLIYSGVPGFCSVSTAVPLHYLTHVVVKLYQEIDDDSDLCAEDEGGVSPTASSRISPLAYAELPTLPSDSEVSNASFPTQPHSPPTVNTIVMAGSRIDSPAPSTECDEVLLNSAADLRAFHMEVSFSSGIDVNPFGISPSHHTTADSVTPMVLIHQRLTMEDLERIMAVSQLEGVRYQEEEFPTIHAELERRELQDQQSDVDDVSAQRHNSGSSPFYWGPCDSNMDLRSTSFLEHAYT